MLEFVYLGTWLTADGSSMKDVESRLAAADRDFNCLTEVWKDDQITDYQKYEVSQRR